MEQAAAFFFNIPGPKMMWQFGELGYDYSINHCPDGTVNTNCRLSNKPIRWDYKNVIQRQRLYDIYSALNKLRFHPWYKDVYVANAVSIDRSLASGFKFLRLRSANDTSCAVVIGNFDVVQQSGTVTFPVAGTWYDYLNGGTFTATGTAQNITLQPGEYRVLLNRNLTNAVVTSTGGTASVSASGLSASLFPNPANSNSVLEIDVPETGKVQVELYNQLGQRIKTVFSERLLKGNHRISLTGKVDKLPAGSYLLTVQQAGVNVSVKMIIQ